MHGRAAFVGDPITYKNASLVDLLPLLAPEADTAKKLMDVFLKVSFYIFPL